MVETVGAEAASAARPSRGALRVYLRRSKSDEGHQQFSLETQRAGCEGFAKQLGLSWSARVEYIDDDRAGDDFVGRAGLQQLIKDASPGDTILCRDQSRIGRKALDVTYVIRNLVAEREAALHYYANGQRVTIASALDEATTFIGGIGHQMEVEAIRSRTKEALRQRARSGRVAGGSCFGYELVRHRDDAGREFTSAAIYEPEAKVIRRIFRDYAGGKGLKRIAKELNEERIASPRAGRRGTGSWSPSTVHAMLRNERYIGIYIHGRAIRQRQGGKKILVRRAKPSELVRSLVSDWRIVDETTWAEVQAIIKQGRRSLGEQRPGGRQPRHALSGIARCAHCGGSIGVARKKVGQVNVKAYGCLYHHTRGSVVCPVTVRQPVEEADHLLADHLRTHVFTEDIIEHVLGVLRQELERRNAEPPAKAAALKSELDQLRTEQRNLIQLAAAGAGDIAELATELGRRAERIKDLETELRVQERTPAALKDTLTQLEAEVRARLGAVREALKARELTQVRSLYEALFPDGLRFRPVEAGPRRVWGFDGEAVALRVVSPAAW